MSGISKFILLLFVLCGITGCSVANSASTSNVPLTETSWEDDVVRCLASAHSTSELMRSNPESFRKTILRKNLDEGLAALEKLRSGDGEQSSPLPESPLPESSLPESSLPESSLPESSLPESSLPESLQTAESEFLFLGASHFPEDFRDRLRACVAKLQKEQPQSESYRLAMFRWLMIAYGQGDADVETSIDRVLQYAKCYAQSPETNQLCGTLAVRFATANDFDATDQFVAKAEQFCDPTQLEPAKRLVAEQREKHRKALAKQGAEERLMLSVRAAMNGQSSGFFVVYSEERSPRKLCNITVCGGADAIFDFAQAAERKNWSWKVLKGFPDSKEGFRLAHNYKQQQTATMTMYLGK